MIARCIDAGSRIILGHTVCWKWMCVVRCALMRAEEQKEIENNNVNSFSRFDVSMHSGREHCTQVYMMYALLLCDMQCAWVFRWRQKISSYFSLPPVSLFANFQFLRWLFFCSFVLDRNHSLFLYVHILRRCHCHRTSLFQYACMHECVCVLTFATLFCNLSWYFA